MSPSRISFNISEYNQYIDRTDNHLQEVVVPDNGTRLGLTTANVADWHTRRTDWDQLYIKYSDPSQCTKVIKEKVNNHIKDFHTFGNPLLNIIASSPAATQDDADIFNFVLERSSPSQMKAAIEEKCNATLKQLGGGDIKVSCRTDHDSTRASLAEHADSVQYAWKAGDTPPANENDGTSKEIASKATFTVHTGTGNVGKKLYLYVRWYHTKHPELAGTWNEMITGTIG